MKRTLFVTLLTCISAAASASQLSDRIAAMAPGEFSELSTGGFTYSLLNAGSGQNILQFAGKAVWDPVRREIDFVGEGHYAGRKHVRYSESSNNWSQLAEPPYIGHAYEHNAINFATGDVYTRPINSIRFNKFTKSTGTWSRLPSVPIDNYQVAGAIEYFPELGGLVFVDSVDGVWLFDESSDQWQRLSQTLAMGHIHNFASYNPVHQIVLFGGGNSNNNMYRLDSNGQITPVADTPDVLGPGNQQGRFTPDTVTGDHLAFFGTGQFYRYDVDDDRWSLLGNHPVASAARDWFNATPVSTYGAVLFMAWDFDSSSVYVYKHANSSGPTDSEAPSVPRNLALGNVSDSRIELDWDAASDNVAALGYRITRNGEEIATVIENYFTDTGLTAGTSYTYSVSAYDFAGNESAASGAATAMTSGTPPPPGGGGGGSGGGGSGGGSDGGGSDDGGTEAAAAPGLLVLAAMLAGAALRRRRESVRRG